MAEIKLYAFYDEFVDYILTKAAPQEILDYRVSDEAQERALYLLDRNAENALTPEEQHELEQMRSFELMMMALKAKALEALESS